MTEKAPELEKGEQDAQLIIIVEAWKKSNYLCKNYIMNSPSDALYNVYTFKKTAKELWDALDYKYKFEDAWTKKFVIGRFLNYKIVDSKTLSSQVEEFQVSLPGSYNNWEATSWLEGLQKLL